MQEQLIYSTSSSEDENDEHQFTINEHYAKAFQYRKEREELAKLKEKYGSDADTDDLSSDGSDSESDESEDEDGEELTPALDVAILRTLARIKARDPGIYDASRNVFEEEHSKSGTLPSSTRRKKKTKGDKPLTLPEQRLAAALDDASSSSSRSASPQLPTHTEEQAALRAETIAAFHAGTAADGEIAEREEEEEEEEGGLFTLREKTRDEVEREEAEYRAYLEREVGPLEKILDLGEEVVKTEDAIRQEEDTHPAEAETGKKKKRKKGRKSAEERKETDQEFLIKCVCRFSVVQQRMNDYYFFRSYILNRGWVDRSARRLPTYKEITAKALSSKDPDPLAAHTGAEVDAGNDDLLDDDEFDEVAEHFESSYNFRFEEPDAAHIQSFPRAIETVRRTTEHAERRRAARERRQERKEAEKAQRREEVKRLKGLKTRELEGKLERIGKEGGWVRSQALQALDLDGDWDATAHDRQMAAMLVETDGADANGDDEKPTWDDDIDIDHIAPWSEDEAQHPSTSLDVKERKKAKKKEKKKTRDVDVDGVDVDEMDADALKDGGNQWDEVEWDGTEEMRKRVLDQYMEELYELEFNDMVAGMPTRFRYNTAAKSSYGLTPTEILLADDKDLNEYVGLKKLAPYRKQRDTWDAKRGERLGEFKKKLSERTGGIGVDLNESEHPNKAKKRRGKKERMREKAAHAPAEADAVTDEG
ncbi:Krr1-domain-containing protein, partial [Lactarius vividus]